jgi:aminoglycoside 2''-phosphotransferase
VALQLDWRAIASEVSGLAIRSTEFIGEGWTAAAYRVDDEFVFKFPKRRAEWEELDREIAFLAYARRSLPLPTVEHLHQVRDSAGAPHGYAIYRFIPGCGVQPRTLSARGRTELAKALAEFLRALHGMNAAPIQSMLPREDEYGVSRQYQQEAEEKIAPHLSNVERRRLRDFFVRHHEDPLNFTVSPRILHADLSVDHVLCVDRSVTGILDWGDVGLGDPDYDFAYLCDDLGEAFVRDMAFHYGHADPDRLVRKTRYFSVVDQIGTIVHGGDRALLGDEAESWVRLRALLHTDA